MRRGIIGKSKGAKPSTELLVGVLNSPYLYRYDVGDWSVLSNPPITSNRIFGIQYKNNGEQVYIGSGNGGYSVKVFNTSDMTLAFQQNLNINNYFGSYLFDDSLLAITTSNNTTGLAVFDTTNNYSLVSIPINIANSGRGRPTFSPNGDVLVVSHYNSPYLTIYNVSDWSKLASPSVMPTNRCYSSDFSPEGELFAICSYGSPYLLIYNSSDYSNVSISSPGNIANDCRFSRDGKYLAVALEGSPYLVIYNVSDWSKITSFTAPTAPCNSVSFSNDSNILAVASDDTPYIFLYDTNDWSRLPNPSTIPTSSALASSFN